MHAHFYRERLGRKPSEVLRGFVFELERMALQVEDMQERSVIMAQVEGLEDLQLAVAEQETALEELAEEKAQTIRDLLLAGFDDKVDRTSFSTVALLEKFMDTVDAESDRAETFKSKMRAGVQALVDVIDVHLKGLFKEEENGE